MMVREVKKLSFCGPVNHVLFMEGSLRCIYLLDLFEHTHRQTWTYIYIHTYGIFSSEIITIHSYLIELNFS